ncbi:hypothetical protein CCMSSC00406_0005576 [Pleurotus cornucopiae]|uniref:Uncharacterized protein n=1 Tax=Pleurotus cornucopiae TaxID=5321 RepID=A0ACB7ITV9_PLECO|nr:hypothetical protein CCMSSC00406_0005576 [Pleurotus cornucopiae]
MNAINRHELFVLDEGENPVEVTEDTKIPNAATIRIAKQDHTLGNMVRAQLLSMPSVLFAGYKVPHPLQPYFIIKVQTDGTITPQFALETACNDLIKMVGDLEGKFKREFAFKDADGATGSNAAGGPTAGGDDPYGGGGGWSEGKDYLDF